MLPNSQSFQSSQPRVIDPLRGEIWTVALNPTKGDEIQKMRPCLVVSSDGIRGLELRVIVPLTSWQAKFAAFPYCVEIKATGSNGLANDSVANGIHVRSVSLERFGKKVGQVTTSQIAEVVAGVGIVIEVV